MAEINDLLYQLRLADQSTTQLFEKRLGISLTRYQILQDLLEQAPCNQIAVQERLQIDPAALTRHFKILEKEGFVHRSRNPKNQREILIHLTDTAYNRLVKHPPRHHVAVKEQMSRILTAQEQEQFSYLLNKEELARPSVTSLFKNQGIYNALIGVFLLYGLFVSKNSEVVTIFVLFIIGAAAYGAMTANKKIILTQGGPAILALLSILFLG